MLGRRDRLAARRAALSAATTTRPQPTHYYKDTHTYKISIGTSFHNEQNDITIRIYCYNDIGCIYVYGFAAVLDSGY